VKFGALFSSPGSQMLGKEEGYYEKKDNQKNTLSYGLLATIMLGKTF